AWGWPVCFVGQGSVFFTRMKFAVDIGSPMRFFLLRTEDPMSSPLPGGVRWRHNTGATPRSELVILLGKAVERFLIFTGKVLRAVCNRSTSSSSSSSSHGG